MDVETIRKDFPILNKKINGYPLIYFDNTATTQKPRQVIQAISDFYEKYNANIHRGVHRLSQEASEIYEQAHEKTAKFINSDWREVIFTKNTTESINLVAHSLDFNKGDEIVISIMEHHSNMVPWQELVKEKGIVLKIVDVKEDGSLDMEDLKSKIGKKTKLVSITHVSNVLGAVNPVKEICKLAHENQAYCLIDGAQSAPHIKVDMKRIGCDFFAFSAHKMLGPTGMGVLYGTKQALSEMGPFLTGGDMIKKVTSKEASWNDLPWKFEAGTPNIAGAAGFSAALDYLTSIGMEKIDKYERDLAKYAIERIKDAHIYGPDDRAGIISFNLKKIHAHDVAYFLEKKGIAVRSGNHCAQPLMTKMGILGTVRASFYVYNTKKEIDFMIENLDEIRRNL